MQRIYGTYKRNDSNDIFTFNTTVRDMEEGNEIINRYKSMYKNVEIRYYDINPSTLKGSDYAEECYNYFLNNKEFKN